MPFLAYHITWGTYGTRLHGDPRKTVDRKHNEVGTPFLGGDEDRWEWCKERLKYPAVVLTREQMVFVEKMIPLLCERGGWVCRVCAAGPDHVHGVLSSEHEPETIRKLIKRWLGQELSKRWALLRVRKVMSSEARIVRGWRTRGPCAGGETRLAGLWQRKGGKRNSDIGQSKQAMAHEWRI